MTLKRHRGLSLGEEEEPPSPEEGRECESLPRVVVGRATAVLREVTLRREPSEEVGTATRLQEASAAAMSVCYFRIPVLDFFSGAKLKPGQAEAPAGDSGSCVYDQAESLAGDGEGQRS